MQGERAGAAEAGEGRPVQYHLTIKELPATERPREKLLANGAGSLSTGELLAIILRTGTHGEMVVDLAARLLSTEY